MKSILKLSFTALLITLFTSCSSDDSSDGAPTGVNEQIVGKWYFNDPSNNPLYNNSFTFTSNGNVTYSYWDGNEGNNFDSETGSFSYSGDVMTMIFPETVTLTYVQKVVFINDNVVEFVSTGNPNEDAWDGIFYRDGADSYETPIDLDKLNLFVDTGNALRTGCDGTYNTDAKININLTYFSDGKEVDSKSISSTQGFQIHEKIELEGDVISVKVRLEDFNANTLDKGIILYDSAIRIETLDETVLVNELLGELFICTDSRYEVEFTYDKVNKTSSVKAQTDGF